MQKLEAALFLGILANFFAVSYSKPALNMKSCQNQVIFDGVWSLLNVYSTLAYEIDEFNFLEYDTHDAPVGI